ncbi:MAG TPA: porin family protein [Saprospiraceae bacterium]|nr:porin family protein [Saprospiraceae bacterium]HPI08586.1 porin family protein [Saprospiraceae bacterium]
MKLKCVFTLFLAVASLSMQAQLRYGFKTGLNFATIKGDSELGANGNNLESWKNATGFQIGITLGYPITDNFGVRGELMYSKKGTKYTFDGPSYKFFRNATTTKFTTGNARYLVNINNSYLDIPIMAYGRWGDFEISGGVYGALLLQSVGEGALTYSNAISVVPPNNPVSELKINLSYNYRKDDPGEGLDGETVSVQVDAAKFDVAKTQGAYYDYTEDRGSLYNSFDYGLVGGVSYYIGRALYLSARVQYGLSDLTKNEADLAKGSVNDDLTLKYRDDKDRNFVIQASVGFSF